MSAHTPGPWQVFPGLLSGYQQEVSIRFESKEERLEAATIRANARLIAAAPEMYEQLVEWAAIDCDQHPYPPCQEADCLSCSARALIAEIEDKS